MRKTDKRTENVMLDRMNWLKKWVKGRGYDISKQKRFLYIYYCTIRTVYGEDWAVAMIKSMNEKLSVPLDEEKLEAVIKEANKKVGYKLSNVKIIKDLGITEQEIEEYEIGHRMKEEQERKNRAFDKFILYTEVITRYQNGERIKEIAETTEGCSKATIERWIKDSGLSKERKDVRNNEIICLHQLGKSDAEIAEITGHDIKTVKSVVSSEKPSFFFVEEKLKNEKELSYYKIAGCSSFYCLYKSETRVATVDSYTEVLTMLQSTKDNTIVTGAAGTAKSFLIKEFYNSLSKEEQAVTTVVAPTGCAAEHINGETIQPTE